MKVSTLIFSSLIMVLSIGCGGGSGDDSGSDVSRNACGVIGLNTKIINGTECSDESKSPVVRIEIVNPSRTKFSLCSGTMISSTAVVTAAHCFEGTAAFVQINVDGTAYPASSVRVHPNFQKQPNQLLNDIAVVRLVRAPGLPTLPLGVSQSVEAGDVISIFGYGVDSNKESDVLRSGQSRVHSVDSEHIQVIYDGEGSNTCQGDSGGPAFFSISGRETLVGVTSTGTVTGCGKGDDSLFTNIQKPEILSFIRNQVPEAETL